MFFDRDASKVLWSSRESVLVLDQELSQSLEFLRQFQMDTGTLGQIVQMWRNVGEVHGR